MPRILSLLAQTLFIGTFALGCSDDSGDGGPPADPVSFATDIHPIFVAKCGECHNVDLGGSFPGHALSDVDDAYDAATQDGVEGEKVYERILVRTNPEDPSLIMPPGCGDGLDDGNCLTTMQYELIEAWIEQGTPR